MSISIVIDEFRAKKSQTWIEKESPCVWAFLERIVYRVEQRISIERREHVRESPFVWAQASHPVSRESPPPLWPCTPDTPDATCQSRGWSHYQSSERWISVCGETLFRCATDPTRNTIIYFLLVIYSYECFTSIIICLQNICICINLAPKFSELI